jgi:hypothetical protein
MFIYFLFLLLGYLLFIVVAGNPHSPISDTDVPAQWGTKDKMPMHVSQYNDASAIKIAN